MNNVDTQTQTLNSFMEYHGGEDKNHKNTAEFKKKSNIVFLLHLINRKKNVQHYKLK